MPENSLYLPEGSAFPAVHSIPALQAALEKETILEGLVLRCDAAHNLEVSLGGILTGEIPREEVPDCSISGANREISILTRVGKPICFVVTSIGADEAGKYRILLSRRRAQEKALEWFLQNLVPGMVLRARITHLENFGAFVDIGCGVISMLPIESISVSRISHPKDRFALGQKIWVVLTAIDRAHQRFHLSHKELLGTWLENAAAFHPGETVRGIVRSVKEYGIFVELLPNLSGLADLQAGIFEGDAVSVYLKSIQPERMKVKLQIIDKLAQTAHTLRYQITDGQLVSWRYSPPGYCKAPIETIFTS